MNREELVTKADIESAKNEIILQMKELLGQTVSKDKKLLRSKDVMEMLKISSSSLQNLRVNHVLPYYKVSGTLFYDYADIMAILSANKAE